MATRNIVPRATNEGSIGTSSKKWSDVQTVLFNGAAVQAAQFTTLASDQSTTSSTYADVTGLANFSLVASATYYVKFHLLVTTSATTEGINCTLNASAAVSTISLIHQYPTSATAWTIEQINALQGGTANTNGPGATVRDYLLEGYILTSGAATLALQSKTETNTTGTSTVKAGSFGFVQRIA